MDIALHTKLNFTGFFRKKMETDLSDDEVVKRVLRGDTDLFRRLVKNYEKQVFTLCLRMLGNQEDAEDCAQTAFLKAYRALNNYRPGQSFKSWVYASLSA